MKISKSCLILVLILLLMLLAACNGATDDGTVTISSPTAGEKSLSTSTPVLTPVPSATDTPEQIVTHPPSPTSEQQIDQDDTVIPIFVNHPKPDSTLDFSAFENAGCPADQWGRRFCEPDSPLMALGCHLLAEPSSMLSYLEPNYPIMICVVKPTLGEGNYIEEIDRLREEGSFVIDIGGLDPEFYRYALVRDDTYEILETVEDFREVFAPIESSDEALGYALALTQATALYDLEYNPNLEYTITELEDTHVEEDTEGYLINLYHYQEFGCGPHLTVLVEVRVSTAGELEEIARTPVFRDPAEDDLCVD